MQKRQADQIVSIANNCHDSIESKFSFSLQLVRMLTNRNLGSYGRLIIDGNHAH